MLTFASYSEKTLNLARYLTVIAAIAAPISTAATSASSIAVLVLWLLSGRALQTLKWSYRQNVGKMLLLFAAWLLIGTLYAETGWHEKITTLLSWKKLLFVYVLLGIFTEDAWKKRFVFGYLTAMALVAVLAAASWLSGWDVRGLSPGIVMTNNSAQSMAFIAAALCGLFLAQNAESKLKRYGCWAAVSLFLFDIFFVGTSRSPYLAAIVALVFAAIAVYGRRKAAYVIGLASLAAVLIGVSSPRLQERVSQAMEEHASYRSSDHDTSIGTRAILYENTLEQIRKRPVLGYGTSSFEKTYGEIVTAKYSDWRAKVGGDPHNQYLFVWLENGLLGLFLFAAYIFAAIRQGLNNKPYGAIAASFLVAICVSSLFNSHFKTFPEGYLLAFFLGALLARHDLTSPADGKHA